MVWIAFGVGLLIGTFLGILIVGILIWRVYR